jgi:NADH-quinone oxidoreductase subunit L
VLTAAAGASIAVLLYGGRVSEPLTARVLEPIRRKFYFDEAYEFIVRNLQGTFAALLSFLDRWVLEFAVFRGISSFLRGFGTSLRQLQAGNVQIYAFLFGVGLVFLIWWKLLK